MKKQTVIALLAIVLVIGILVGVVVSIMISGHRNSEWKSFETKQNTTPDLVKKPNKDGEENFIGEDSAKEIALAYVNLSESDVKFEKIKLDFDDGIWQYEIEFRQDRTEYDLDIHAETGEIIASDIDYND